MRKRSKYRPKPIRTDVMGYVLESMTPVAQHGSTLLDLKIKNHDAMLSLTQGTATPGDMKMLTSMANMSEGLRRLGIGVDFINEVREGTESLVAIVSRCESVGNFVARAREMTALNTLLALHDAQLEAATVADVEKALAVVRKDIASGKATVLQFKGKA